MLMPAPDPLEDMGLPKIGHPPAEVVQFPDEIIYQQSLLLNYNRHGLAFHFLLLGFPAGWSVIFSLSLVGAIAVNGVARFACWPNRSFFCCTCCILWVGRLHFCTNVDPSWDVVFNRCTMRDGRCGFDFVRGFTAVVAAER